MTYIIHNIGTHKNPNYNTREEIQNTTGLLTFDGIYKNVWENRDILKGREFILFYSGDFVGGNNDFDVKNPFNGAIIYPEDFTTQEQLDELVAIGGKLGWHTWSHPDLTKLTREQMIREITPPFPMEDFCYPYGKWNDEVIQIVKDAGFKRAWSVERTDGTNWTIPRRFIR